jgi:hypothetical protein
LIGMDDIVDHRFREDRHRDVAQVDGLLAGGFRRIL